MFKFTILPTIHFHHSRLVPAIWIQVKNFHREIYSLFDLRLVGIFLTFSISHNSTQSFDDCCWYMACVELLASIRR